MHSKTVTGKARFRGARSSRYRASQPTARNLSDATIKGFVDHLKEYAAQHHLGKPTLLFAQNPHHFGVCLDWRDDRRAFSLMKGAWTGDDYAKLCDMLRGAW